MCVFCILGINKDDHLTLVPNVFPIVSVCNVVLGIMDKVENSLDVKLNYPIFFPLINICDMTSQNEGKVMFTIVWLPSTRE